MDAQRLAIHMAAKGISFGEHSLRDIERIITQNGYYRMRGYWLTLEDEHGIFPGISVDDILEIMELDRELRAFILQMIAPIEMCFKSVMATELALRYGADALYNSAAFCNQIQFRKTSEIVNSEIRRAQKNDLDYVTHNLKQYGLLPIWAILGLTTFGTASKIFGNISDSFVKKQIALVFKTSAIHLKSWLEYLSLVRNISAHNERLYYTKFTVRPKLYREHRGIDNARELPIFIILFRLHDAMDARKADAYRREFAAIINRHPGVSLEPMGFPENWRDILKIPADCPSVPRPRGRNGGRPRADRNAVQEALYLYDLRTHSIREITAQAGISTSTLYKYLRERDAQRGGSL